VNHSSTYHLDLYNCTDFAIGIGNAAGLNLPESDGTWPGGGGSNPGTLGSHIRGLNSTGNITINKVESTAPLTNKDC